MTKTQHNSSKIIGDIFGGLAAMLVALPSAIAFGLIIFGPLGPQFSGKAAIAGILGTICLGLVAPVFGGTPRLITAPCAPAAAVLSVFVLELMNKNILTVELIPLYLAVSALLAGLVQFVIGYIGGGKFIKYIPYPVVAGYLSGVGVLIFLGQYPKFLGLPKEVTPFQGLISLEFWNWKSIVIGAVTMAVMFNAPKIIKKVPAAIIALSSGIITYFILSLVDSSLLSLENNKMVIGPIAASTSDIFTSITSQWSLIPQFEFSKLAVLFVPLMTLAVLLSIDTLKTCVVMDALTQSRHNPNKELIGQGLGNITSAVFGGIPGAGTMGATLVNLNSGAQSRLSGVLTGIFSLLVLLLLGNLIAWIPLSALAGVLIVVAIRMLDIKSLNLLKHKTTILDFFVILAVVISAVSMSLIVAAGVGIAMAILLFLREQVRFPVIRRKFLGNQTFSKKRRLPSELEILHKEGQKTSVFELQGQLFFGTTDQLLSEIEPHFKEARYIVLNMRRVQSLDYSAANLLKQIQNRVKEKNGTLCLASVPLSLPTGQSIKSYLENLGLSEAGTNLKFFDDLDEALEWIEEKTLSEHQTEQNFSKSLDLSDFEIFADSPKEVLDQITQFMKSQSFKTNELIFKRGEESDEMYFIRKGTVKIALPLTGGMSHHLASFSQGDFFGDMSFLDKGTRSANAIALEPVDLFILARSEFNRITEHHPEIATLFFERLANGISQRLRQTNVELMALQES